MERVLVITEDELKKWISEAVAVAIKPTIADPDIPVANENLLTRPEAAKLLRINVCTLTQWTKCGLPHYRKRGRVYYARSEVLLYMRKNHPGLIAYADKYQGFEKE